MKEYPTVYVLSSWEDGIAGVYYNEQDAIKDAKSYVVRQKLDAKDWQSYYRIDECKVIR